MSEKIYIPRSKTHLDTKIPGVKPIFACVGKPSDFESLSFPGARQYLYKKLENPRNVDYAGDPYVLRKENYLNAGYNTFTISPIDGTDKFSEGYWDCTGLVVAGIDKDTGENISFISHQDPKSFLFDEYTIFTGHIKRMLLAMKDRCKPETIDAIIVGGQYPQRPDITDERIKQEDEDEQKKYLETMQLLTKEVKDAFGFEPSVANGPKRYRVKDKWGADHIYYDNRNRRLYFLRANINEDTADFTNTDFKEVEETWKEDKNEKAA